MTIWVFPLTDEKGEALAPPRVVIARGDTKSAAESAAETVATLEGCKIGAVGIWMPSTIKVAKDWEAQLGEKDALSCPVGDGTGYPIVADAL